MATAANATLWVEQGQTLVENGQLTDSGDHKVFVADDDVFSSKSGYTAVVRRNGVASGLNLLSAHADDDTVTVAAFTAYSKGVLRVVSATTAEIVRPETKDCQVFSITMTDAGAIAVVDGAEGDSLVDTRGADGGPPLIPADSVEIGQVRVTSQTPAEIAPGEIYQQAGQHVELSYFPEAKVNPVGLGASATVAAKTSAFVEFDAALPAIHDDGDGGAAASGVYLTYYVPVLAETSRVFDFAPPETTYSITSTAYYGGSVASETPSLGQGSFSALMNDGVTDALVKSKGQRLTFKFFPDRNKTAYILCQGTLGVTRTFPVSGQMQMSATISSEVECAEFAG